ncbi:nocobactin polyketide synthase NbtC [Nocardia cerradoensis]|uniref:nocobactin polyketide synthase NbtC n=1 Tax=Nocardia cerradoensis TaxID=85688 RepID=UPI0002DD3448|nr:nocobactin polyketide synthase NbtC [Nocardia cerradoensis]NKY48258.1 nocobactin polyketide synthase NbtC [Nocardia cerradoensis]
MSSYRLPDGSIPILLSSDNPDLLGAEAAAIADYLAGHPEVTPDRVADMLFRTRSPRRHRALVMAGAQTDVIAALRAVADGHPHPAVVRSERAASAQRVAYVFPGQGSQRPGMGAMLYEHSSAYRDAVDECDKVFHDLYGWSPRAYLLEADRQADDKALTVQPALFMQMVGVAAMWQAAGVTPRVTVGHSQGEIAAAYVSGAQTLRDAVRIVTTRAQIVDSMELTGYSMAVLGVDRDECEDLIARQADFVELSVINSRHIIAISGERTAVVDIVETLNAAGKFAKEIRVQYPAHTSFVATAREPLSGTVSSEMDNAAFLDADIECFGATFGDRLHSGLSIVDYWYLNLRNRVRFDLAVKKAAAAGATTFVEISEHPTLMLAIQENLSEIPGQREFQALGTSRRTAEDLREFTRNLATVAVHDANYRWEALREPGDGGVPALPLLDFPNTRMSAKSLWAPFDYARAAHKPLADSDSDDSTVAPQRVVETWTRLQRRTMVPPRTFAVIDPAGANEDLAAAVRAAAPRQGATVAEPGSGTRPDTVVVLAPPSSADGPVHDVAEFLGARAWLDDLDGIGDIWLVTSGGEQVVESDLPDPFHAAVQAGFRCLAAEHVGVAFRHADLGAGADAAAAAKALLGAIHIAAEPELAVRDGGFYAKRLILDDTAGDAPLRAEELCEVVIVGGTGKLGLDFCAQFAAAGAGRITLISRSGGTAAAGARIAEIGARYDTEVVVRRCDAGDAEALGALAAEYAASPATLIVHAAVDYEAAAADPDPATIRAAAAAKSVVLHNLVRIFPRTDDGRVVVCSSLSATLGGRGHMVYSAINRMLDAQAAHYRAEGIRCSSVQWGLWRAVGADHAEALARISGTGLLPMDPAVAVAAGFAPRAANVLVAAAQWGRIRDLFSVFGFAPLFAELPEDEPAPVSPVAEPAAAPVPAADVAAGSRDVADSVRDALRVVMGLEPEEAVDGSVPLVALGLDSLQALDLRKRVEAELRRDLPVTAILGGASLDEVVALLG